MKYAKKLVLNIRKKRKGLLFLCLLAMVQATGQMTFRDNFSTVSYANNDGNTSWANNWTETNDFNLGPTAEYIRIQSQQLYMYWLWEEDIRRTANLNGTASATLSFTYTSANLSGTQRLGVFLSNNGGATFTQIATLSGNGSFSQDISSFISSNTVVRFAKSDVNWGSSQSIFIDNLEIMAFLPDHDGDGIPDVADLDNDNDGILDSDECPFIPLVTQNFTSSGGTTVTNTATIGQGRLYVDFLSIDNSFNLTVNGTNIATEFQFQPGAPGNFARFDTGFTYGQNGVPQLWSMTGTLANPMLRVIVDEDGGLQLFGAQSPGGTLLELTLDTPPVTVPWNPFGGNTISIGQLLTGPTNMNGQLRFSGECDTDGDGIPNRFDLDSDNDGIYDAVEAGHGQAHTNGVVNGAVGADGVPDTVQANPNSGLVNYTVSDVDGNGEIDARSLDSDADGCNDVLEAGYTDPNGDGLLGNAPLSTDANGLVTSGTDGYTLPLDGNANAIFDFQESGLAPGVATQPLNSTICLGCVGTFTVIGSNADTFQWQRFNGGTWEDLANTGIYSGTTTANLTLTAPSLENQGEQYRVILSNSAFICSEAVSNVALLSIQVNTVISNRRITYRVNTN